AGRMIAPYVGMSLYTWTAIIAVVLAGFSAGHWWGGRIAVRQTPAALVRTGWIMLAAALSTALAVALLRWIAGPLLTAITDPLAAISALAAAVFFLPSLFAGVPAPVLAVVAMRGRGTSEHALGGMFAAGALGAIAGTLAAGFVLIPRAGTTATMLVVAGVYVAAALILFGLGRLGRAGRVAAASGVAALGLLGLHAAGLPAICDRESSYYCIRTVDLSEAPGDPVHLMVIDHLAHGISAGAAPRVMFTDHTAMLDALPRMRMARSDFSSFHIGGGSYSVPRAWADRGIGAVTVAEIDPEVTAQAAADFWFDPATAEIVHRDARVVLRESPRRYDVIVGDAFTDIAVPEHLVTREFFALVAERLAPGGVFAMNLIDNVDRLDALAAVLVTLRAVLPSVEVWTEARPPEPGERRIFVLLAGAEDSPVSSLTARAPEPKAFSVLAPDFLDDVVARRSAQVLTDDRAPFNLLMGLDPVLR
ncbi:MAG: fused MFS/spermidine synthase, partial [Maritimibacter sp.]|nr:fused MFS/spermidine synthase [Maritimibacter sp.]